jgi:hypothetical protein
VSYIGQRRAALRHRHRTSRRQRMYPAFCSAAAI